MVKSQSYYNKLDISKYSYEYFFRFNPIFHTRHINFNDVFHIYAINNNNLYFFESDIGNYQYNYDYNIINPFNGTFNQWLKYHNIQKYKDLDHAKLMQICNETTTFGYPLLNFYTSLNNNYINNSINHRVDIIKMKKTLAATNPLYDSDDEESDESDDELIDLNESDDEELDEEESDDEESDEEESDDEDSNEEESDEEESDEEESDEEESDEELVESDNEEGEYLDFDELDDYDGYFS